jgi:hypothetical protein
MKKYLILALAILAIGSYAISASLFSYPGVRLSGFATNSLTDDGGSLILIKYFGTAELATLDINSNSLEFHVSSTAGGSAAAPTADSAADVEVDDLCGDVAGALDLTDVQCDTWTELVAYINTNSASHRFVAVLIGELPATTIDVTFITDPADANLKVPGGFALESDTSDHDAIASLVAPWVNRPQGQDDIRAFVDDQGDLRKNVVSEDLIPFLSYAWANLDGTGTPTCKFYSSNYETNGNGVPVNTLLWSEAFTDDTATEFFQDKQPLVGFPGEIIFVLCNGQTAQTDATLHVQGAFGRFVNE